MIVIVNPWLFRLFKTPPYGMALYPFVLLKQEAMRHDRVLLNHEKIHLQQQLELLVLPFYVLYLLNYLVNLYIYRNRYQAYREICFEREAYQHELNPDYLRKRKPLSFLIHLRPS